MRPGRLELQSNISAAAEMRTGNIDQINMELLEFPAGTKEEQAFRVKKFELDEAFDKLVADEHINPNLPSETLTQLKDLVNNLAYAIVEKGKTEYAIPPFFDAKSRAEMSRPYEGRRLSGEEQKDICPTAEKCFEFARSVYDAYDKLYQLVEEYNKKGTAWFKLARHSFSDDQQVITPFIESGYNVDSLRTGNKTEGPEAYLTIPSHQPILEEEKDKTHFDVAWQLKGILTQGIADKSLRFKSIIDEADTPLEAKIFNEALERRTASELLKLFNDVLVFDFNLERVATLKPECFGGKDLSDDEEYKQVKSQVVALEEYIIQKAKDIHLDIPKIKFGSNYRDWDNVLNTKEHEHIIHPLYATYKFNDLLPPDKKLLTTRIYSMASWPILHQYKGADGKTKTSEIQRGFVGIQG